MAVEPKDIGFLLGGFAVGYAICWWNRPLPALQNTDQTSKVQNPAKTILQTADSIDNIRPLLIPISKGSIPSPAVIYDIIKGF
jgi:hypothetical protein